MRYFRVEFLDEAQTPGFMEVTDEGAFARLTDIDGNTLAEGDLPHTSYRTLDTKEAEKPAWGV